MFIEFIENTDLVADLNYIMKELAVRKLEDKQDVELFTVHGKVKISFNCDARPRKPYGKCVVDTVNQVGRSHGEIDREHR